MRAAVAQTLRTDVSSYHFHPAAIIGVPLLALFVQWFLPFKLHFISWLDLPLLVTIFFAVSRRNQVQGLLTGAAIGLLQDSLTSFPLGVYGLAKTLVGFIASSLSVKVDSENPGSRLLIVFGFYLLHQAVYFLVAQKMAQIGLQWQWHVVLLQAVANAVAALPLFWVLDKLKQRA